VVFPGTLAATAPRPSWSFSREIVKRMPEGCRGALLLLLSFL
jgi:hypothetical protein